MGISNTFKMIEKYLNYTPYRKKLSFLRGKRVAIDASIYMWKFKINESELGIFYFIKFLNVLLKNGIIPIFVIDGKPSWLKKQEIEKRKQRNLNMVSKIRLLEETGGNDEELRILKINSRIVNTEDWKYLEDILNYYGICWTRVHGREAEGYCSYLNRTGQVDYVMTEDTDVFLYGALMWIRYMNFSCNDVVIYNLDQMRRDFCTRLRGKCYLETCILFGTDFSEPVVNIDDFDRIVESGVKIEIPHYMDIIYEYISNDYSHVVLSTECIVVEIPDLMGLIQIIPDELIRYFSRR